MFDKLFCNLPTNVKVQKIMPMGAKEAPLACWTVNELMIRWEGHHRSALVHSIGNRTWSYVDGEPRPSGTGDWWNSVRANYVTIKQSLPSFLIRCWTIQLPDWQWGINPFAGSVDWIRVSCAVNDHGNVLDNCHSKNAWELVIARNVEKKPVHAVPALKTRRLSRFVRTWAWIRVPTHWC